ncbi:MAG: hypothetical protein IPO67_18650 [Deltaproteobacteria bacterium]|nr:hypothetical protein [Deltaproteobacteria bacterium]
MTLPIRFNMTILLALATLACRSKDDALDSVDTNIDGPEDTADTAVDDDIDNTYEICEDITWSGEVIVGAVYYVCPTATLTIAADTQVKFMPSAGLVVDGTLKLEGSDGAPVVFTTNYSSTAGNYGVSVGGTGDKSTLQYATFEHINLRLEGGGRDGDHQQRVLRRHPGDLHPRGAVHR